MAAVAMLAAVSCNKEITNVDPVTPEADAVVYTAYVDGAQTKTYLGETTGEGNSKQTAALWAANDAITIHNGETAYTFTTTDNATSAAQFEYDMQNGEYEAGEGVMAVYPSGEYTADVEAKTVSGVVIPETQTLVAGTYPATAAAAIAYTDNNTVEFKNATAILKFKVAGDDVKFGAFYGVQDVAKLSGTFDVDYNEGDPTVAATAGNHWVNFNLNGEVLSKEAVYYVAIAPGEVENFAVSLNDTEIMKKNGTFTFKRNVIYDLGTITYETPAWVIRGSMNNWGTTPDIAMTLDGDWYVAENVELKATDEFKFYYDDGSQYGAWRGANNNIPATVGETTLGGDSNISVELPGIYTVSLSKDTKTMKLEKTADLELDVIDPATAGVDKVRVGLTGSKATWNWEDPSSEKGSLATFASKEVTNAEDFSGNYTFTMTDVEFDANEQFKIRVDIDGAQGWYGVGTTVSGIEYTGGDNFVVSAAGTYDVAISFTYDGEKQSASNISAVFTKTSVDPEPEPEPEPTQVRIYVDSSWGWPYIWCWDSTDTQIFAGASWPGTRYHGEENGYYYWNVPETYVGKTVSLLAVKAANDEQTSNFTGVLLDKSVYFKLEWTQELGCHLVKEDK